MLSPVDQTIRTDMEAGPARVRRRTHARNDFLNVSILFTAAEMAAFRTWFESDADGGAAWFDIELDVGDGAPSLQEARFKGAWKANRQDLHWQITAELEVR
jgi:hypothetical protein